MKVTLTFNVPDEAYSLYCAQHGEGYRRMIENLWQRMFRNALKHNTHPRQPRELTEEEFKLLEDLSDIYQEEKSGLDLLAPF